MKRISTMIVLGLMCSTAALADSNAMQSNSMSGSTMTNTNAMSGSSAMAPAKPAHKTKVKAPAKTGGMIGPGNDESVQRCHERPERQSNERRDRQHGWADTALIGIVFSLRKLGEKALARLKPAPFLPTSYSTGKGRD